MKFQDLLNEQVQKIDYNRQLKIVRKTMDANPAVFTKDKVKQEMDKSIKAYQKEIRYAQTNIKKLKQDKETYKQPRFAHKNQKEIQDHLDNEIKKEQQDIDTSKENIKTAKKIQQNI